MTGLLDGGISMKKTVFSVLLFIGLICTLFSGCGKAPVTGGPVVPGRLQNGVYEGTASAWPNSAKVKVTVAAGKIAGVELVSHFASWRGKKAEVVIPVRIIEQQSTNVDAVTGATNSSRVIMNAVQDAVEKACPK